LNDVSLLGTAGVEYRNPFCNASSLRSSAFVGIPATHASSSEPLK